MDTPTTTPTRRALANAIRALSMDAVQAANSGHPGAPMGMADIAEVLWRDFLKHNPGNPRWWNRDRFVLSNGHGSMLLYSLLHLTGYPLGIDEIKNFRQLGARTAGHPEHESGIGGIETTTGPLGQGLANAVGMALAEKLLAGEFNRDGLPIVDHHTYCFVGDGCLMEGISHEACSLAGTFKLGKLIVFYDDNGISIDGKVDEWFTDDTPKRFEAYGWHVVKNVDGHDADAVLAAIKKARSRKDQPSLICCKTIIGWGAPNKQGTKSAHGEALGPDEVALARKTLGWEYPPFEIPADIRAAWDHKEAGAAAEKKWNRIWKRYKREHAPAAAEFERRMKGELPAELAGDRAGGAERGRGRDRLAGHARLFAAGAERARAQARRDARRLGGSHRIGEHAAQGFEADHAREPDRQLRLLRRARVRHDGHHERHHAARRVPSVRRHVPGVLGLRAQCGAPRGHHALPDHAGVHARFHRPRRGRPDAPAHRASRRLRAMPNLHVWRACDAVESAYSWVAALERKNGPTALVFTRQGLPQQPRTPEQLVAHAQGRLRAHRQQRSAGSHRDRHGFGSRHRGAGGQGTAGRGQTRAPGVHALLRGLRRAARAVSRKRAAGCGHATRRRRGGRHAVVVALRGLAGPRARHRPASAPPARARTCSSISASPARQSRRWWSNSFPSY